MRIIAVIPARYASTRFPAKLMQDLGGKSVIRTTYEAALNTQLFDDVFVVTDESLIFDEITNHGGKAIMSKKNHESGSDRIAEAIENMEVDLVVNVQGDEPFMQKEPLSDLIEAFRNDPNQLIDLASLMRKMDDISQVQNPNVVKVVVDNQNFALYFSRSPIPFLRDSDTDVDYYQHIGVYAFRKKALLDFYHWPVQDLERIEKLEQLRYLSFGKKIKMVETKHVSIGIDTADDLEAARAFLSQSKKS
ncbi:MAG: 3-deoxy-manno-octulosonate cytidylyltransferase [Flavobacterium sp.]